MVKQTIGFNWGPSGTSCSTWTGVRLADVLLRCGIQRTAVEGGAYVCFRGPKGEQRGGRGACRLLLLLLREQYSLIS